MRSRARRVRLRLSPPDRTGWSLRRAGSPPDYATSSDGSHWVLSPRYEFPADFALDDLEGTSTGYVAIGASIRGGSVRAAALWSADGRHWPKTPTLLPNSPSGSEESAFSNAVTLMVGDHGMIAVGIGEPAGAAVWWRSLDGRHWQPLETFRPSGRRRAEARTATCSRTRRSSPTVIGSSRSRGGSDAAALVSTDGQRWTPLRLSGDIPSGQAQAVLLPGGVLVSDGTDDLVSARP